MMDVPPLMTQGERDEQHLKLLSIFHYVSAALGAAALLFLGVHGVVTMSVFLSVGMSGQSSGESLPVAIMPLMLLFYLILGLAIVGKTIADLLSARFLRTSQYRTFSLVVAGINCLNMLLGTVLGVFTIIVLMRDSVQARYLRARSLVS